MNRIVDDLKRTFDFFKTHPLLGTDPYAADPAHQPRPAWESISNYVRQRLGNSAEILNFISSPRFDDPAYLTTLGVVLATVFVAMSWFSRSRFSPFGRPGQSPSNGQVSDADFSYITSEDLKNQPEIVDWDDKNPNRQTDVLVFKNGRTNYPTHFAAQSIRNQELKIGTVRQAAAKKIGVDDPRRIRLFFKGRNLKHDDRTAREEGLRGDGNGSEILVVVGEAGAGHMEDSDDDDETESGLDSGTNSANGKKKNRKRGGKKSKKKPQSANASGSNTPGLAYSNATETKPEYLPIPSHLGGPARPTSAPPPNAPRSATPQTPMGKLDAIASKFHTEMVPMCITFTQNPPHDPAKKSFEYKKLSETILTQVLMKLDGVETEGDQDVRAKRKALVKEVNAMLNKLDEVGK